MYETWTSKCTPIFCQGGSRCQLPRIDELTHQAKGLGLVGLNAISSHGSLLMAGGHNCIVPQGVLLNGFQVLNCALVPTSRDAFPPGLTVAHPAVIAWVQAQCVHAVWIS